MAYLLRFFKKGEERCFQRYENCHVIPAVGSYVYVVDVKFRVLDVSISYGECDDTLVMVDVTIEEVEEEYDD